MLELNQSEQHFWLCRPDELSLDDNYLQQLEAVLDEEERARMQRFKFRRHAVQFCISHAFTRYVLSQYAELDYSQWRFYKNEHGKPYIANPGLGDLQFSLSHTSGLQAMLVGRGPELGCDVEARNSRVRGRDIAHRFFSEPEVQEFMRSTEQRERECFFDFWALKESYIKAKGKGLAISLGKFGFSLENRPIAFWANEELQEQGRSWRFELLEVGPEHAAAIAIQQQQLQLSCWLAQPLLQHRPIVLPVR